MARPRQRPGSAALTRRASCLSSRSSASAPSATRAKKGSRWYAQYRLPAEFGGEEITLRLHRNDEDAKKRLNRAENLRAIPRSDPDFARLYARRADAESINRALEDTLYWNRAHSVGHLRQTADLLGFALMVNSLTLAKHRAREAVKAAA